MHDLARLAGRDPTRLGALLVAVGLLDRMRHGGLLSKPMIGGAGVAATVPGGGPSPCEFFFWPLTAQPEAAPAGLAKFGPDWQGALLAGKVRTHAASFPMLADGMRGVPKPDLVV